MTRFLAGLRELLAAAFFYVALPGVVLGVFYALFTGIYELENPQEKVHWSQGPNDPVPTH